MTRSRVASPYAVGASDPLLVINPSADREFARACQQAMGSRPHDPMALQAVLRQRFPGAVVRRRALSSETIEIWYVYRDGRWVSSA